MTTLSNILNLIKNDLYKEKKESASLDFFYTSMLHYAISIEIASSSNVSFEKLCRIIPKKFGSRSSIKAVLDDGVFKNFYIKKIDLKDKRIKSYEFSENFSLMITKWYLSRKEKYAS